MRRKTLSLLLSLTLSLALISGTVLAEEDEVGISEPAVVSADGEDTEQFVAGENEEGGTTEKAIETVAVKELELDTLSSKLDETVLAENVETEGIALEEEENDLTREGSTGDGVTYSLDEETGVLTISGNGAMEDYDYSPWRHNVSSVVINEGVTSIGAHSFDSCYDITSVSIANTVTSIGENAFCGCEGLTSINIPESVTTIGNRAFYGCTGLTSVVIPSSVSIIEDNVFDHCKGLTNVEIPNSVTSIEYAAFACCIGLKSVDIPSSVQSIGEAAFLHCRNMPNMYVPKTVTTIGDKALGYASRDTLMEDFTIYGYTTTKAETFADDNTIPFVAIQSAAGEGEAREYEFVVVPEASNTTYTLQSGDTVTIYSTGRLEDFLRLRVDGEIVDPSYYTLRDGSTVLTLLSTYLDKLSPGKHPASLEYKNGVANTTITILKKSSSSPAPSNPGSSSPGTQNPGTQNQGTIARPSGTNYVTNRTPATGDHSNMMLWLALIVISLSCGTVAAVSYKKIKGNR